MTLTCSMNFKVKACQHCGKEYRPTSNHQKYCKECGLVVKRIRNAEWTEAHPEYSASWREAHPEYETNRYAADPEKARARHTKSYKAHPDKAKARAAKRRKEAPEKVRGEMAEWIKANPEYGANWKKANSDKVAVSNSKRRAAKYANTPLDEMLTSTEWLAILAEHNGHCHYCDKEARLTLDHVRPLSKGGKHSKDNVVPACGHCNSSKGNKTLEEWWAKRERERVGAALGGNR